MALFFKFRQILIKRNCTLFFAFFLLAAGFVNAGIIYKEVNITVSATTSEGHKNIIVDMNNDGKNDFTLTHFHPDENYQVVEMEAIGAMKEKEILITDAASPRKLDDGFIINADLSPWEDTWFGAGQNVIHFSEEWAGAKDKYIAVRIKSGDSYQYGWLRLSIPSDFSSVTLRDLALEDTPGNQIITGITNSVEQQANIEIQTWFTITGRELTINLTGCYGSILWIYDMLGNTVFREEIKGRGFSGLIRMTAPGIYFIRLKTEKSENIREISIF